MKDGNSACRRRLRVGVKIIADMQDFIERHSLRLGHGQEQIALALRESIVSTAVNAVDQVRSMKMPDEFAERLRGKGRVAYSDDAQAGTSVRPKYARQRLVRQK